MELSVQSISKNGLGCHLCSSNNVELVFRLQRQGLDYTVILCRECDMLQTVEHYDAVSPDYVNLSSEKIDAQRLWCQSEHKLPAFRHWFSEANRLIGKIDSPLRLLDVGCGTGGFLKFAAEYGMEVYGFDSSWAQVEYAQREFPNVRRACDPLEYLNYLGEEDLQFDIITLWDVLEHIRKPLDFLPSVRSILRPGGLIYVSVPNGKTMLWKRKIYATLGKRHDYEWAPWEHVFYYTRKSLISYLYRTGFKVVRTGSVPCYRRPSSTFELIRRLVFFTTSAFPSQSPQIYAWGKCFSRPV